MPQSQCDNPIQTNTPVDEDDDRVIASMTSTPAVADGVGADVAPVHTHPLTDRRRNPRHKRMFATQMTPWSRGVVPTPVDVIVEDVSQSGVGLLHGVPLELGTRHVLSVPAAGGAGEGERPVSREYVVIRCDARPDGTYAIGMELSIERDSVDEPAPKSRVTTSRTKTLFLAFGLAGLLLAIFLPL